MTDHSFTGARDGHPAGPAPGTTTAARSRAGGTGPGVPLSVWPGLPAPDSPGCGGPVTAAAALRVITAFSVPGDVIAAAGCQPAVTGAAAAAGRAVLALAPDACGGDPPCGPGLVPAAGSPAAGRAALAVAGCPGPGCLSRQQSGRDAGLLYAACERALRPGGVLAVIAGPAGDGTAGGIVAAARAAGLVYAQHIVLVRAAIDGDRLDPAPDPEPGPDLPGPVHDDLLVFTKPGGARP